MSTDNKANESQASFNWRSVLSVHPAADLFPLMAESELKELAKDIKANGLRVSIVLCKSPDGKRLAVLDGRNRLDALALLGFLSVDANGWLTSPAKRFEGGLEIFSCHRDHPDPYETAISLNIHRRHLTAEQKRELIAKLIKATPQKSNRQIAAAIKTSHPTVAKVRDELERKGDVEKVTTSIDTKGRKQPAKRPTPTKPQTANRGVPEPRATSDVPTGSPTATGTALISPTLSIDPSSGRLSVPDRLTPIGPSSTAENKRLRARIDELLGEKRLLEIKIAGLESELGEKKTLIAQLSTAWQIVRNPKDLERLARQLKALLHPDKALHPEAEAQLEEAFKTLADAISEPVTDVKREAERQEERSRREREAREKRGRKAAAKAEATP